MFSGGLLGLLVLIADIWAILQVVQSRESNATKTLWCVLIVVLPAVGVVIWFFAGPRATPG